LRPPTEGEDGGGVAARCHDAASGLYAGTEVEVVVDVGAGEARSLAFSFS
jgi:hypothetical protein